MTGPLFQPVHPPVCLSVCLSEGIEGREAVAGRKINIKTMYQRFVCPPQWIQRIWPLLLCPLQPLSTSSSSSSTSPLFLGISCCFNRFNNPANSLCRASTLMDFYIPPPRLEYPTICCSHWGTEKSQEEGEKIFLDSFNFKNYPLALVICPRLH